MHRQISVDTFPEREVVKALEDWWDHEMSTRTDDPLAKPNTLYDTVVEIDSLSVVRVLLTVQKIVGFEPPVTVIKRGGYRDRQEMINHLVPRIRDGYYKHRNMKPRPTLMPHG